MNYVPMLVLIHVTNECNLNCKHCYARKGINKIEVASFNKLIDSLVEMETKMIHLSGGELLTHEDIFEMIRYVKDKGMYLEITTNGILLNKDILNKLKELQVDKIVISFDGAIAKTHDEIRGLGNYAKSLANLELGLEFGLPMAVNYTVMSTNYDQIEQALEIFLKYNIKFLNFRRFIETGEGKKIARAITSIEYLNLFKMVNRKRETDKRVALGGEPHRILMDKELVKKARKVQMGGCSAGKYFLSIDPNGDITPCGFIPITVGNIYQDEIKDVWKNSELLNKLRDRDSLNGKCKDCVNKNICGGCRAAALGTYGDLFADDPQCWN
ncbi:MAG: radical SAM protein [Candidatus Cloacimonetes bacterium]|nr:radical SAM protein [Candidatus Cloacimonadota bacterium]